MADHKKALMAIRDPEFYIPRYLKIRDKEGKIIPLNLKPAQQKLFDIIKSERSQGRPVRIVILKARQLGFSTMIEGLFFQNAATHSNVRTLIIAHDLEATSNLFRMNKLFYDELPDFIKPMRKASNAKEILFENPTQDTNEKRKNPGLKSSIRCVPATGSGVGRSSTLTNIHASEVAFWSNMEETFDALLQAVPDEKDTSVIIETTPNGFNSFKDFWDDAVSGKNGFMALFFPWYLEPGYVRPVPPGIVWDKEELQLKEVYGLTDEQLSWRRWCIATNMRGDSEKFKQEYPSCAEEAFLMSGNPFFDNRLIILRLNESRKEVRRGYYRFTEDNNGKPMNIEFAEDEDGVVYKYEEPEELAPYVLGGDTAGDGSDRFTAHLLDNRTGNQVAQILYDGGSELFYTQQVYCLATEYNKALTGIEINYSTYPEKKLEEWNTENLYIREKVDDSRGMLQTYKLGFRTDSRTRPLILANLQTVIAQNIDMLESEELLRESLTFIRNKDMRPEAAPGSHDDLVMAAAIAHYIRPQQRYEEYEEEPVEVVKLIDRLDPKHKYRRQNGII